MEAFEELYRTYYSRLYAFLYTLCQDASLSEELTQESFYQAFVSFRRFRHSSDVFTWLASIGKHVYYRYLRKNRLSIDSINIEPVAEIAADENADPAYLVQHQEQVTRMRETIRRLPQKYLDVVLLRVYAELPFAQVAASLGITENSAKVIFCRAKKMLWEELKHDDEL